LRLSGSGRGRAARRRFARKTDGYLAGTKGRADRELGNEIVQRITGDATDRGQYPKWGLALCVFVEPISLFRPFAADAEHLGKLLLRDDALTAFLAIP
jgi:hypothetical protein